MGGLRGFLGPALVVESENDEAIPRQTIESYLSVLPIATHDVIKGATHGLSRPEWREAFVRLLINFFADL